MFELCLGNEKKSKKKHNKMNWVISAGKQVFGIVSKPNDTEKELEVVPYVPDSTIINNLKVGASKSNDKFVKLADEKRRALQIALSGVIFKSSRNDKMSKNEFETAMENLNEEIKKEYGEIIEAINSSVAAANRETHNKELAEEDFKKKIEKEKKRIKKKKEETKHKPTIFEWIIKREDDDFSHLERKEIKPLVYDVSRIEYDINDPLRTVLTIEKRKSFLDIDVKFAMIHEILFRFFFPESYEIKKKWEEISPFTKKDFIPNEKLKKSFKMGSNGEDTRYYLGVGELLARHYNSELFKAMDKRGDLENWSLYPLKLTCTLTDPPHEFPAGVMLLPDGDEYEELRMWLTSSCVKRFCDEHEVKIDANDNINGPIKFIEKLKEDDETITLAFGAPAFGKLDHGKKEEIVPGYVDPFPENVDWTYVVGSLNSTEFLNLKITNASIIIKFLYVFLMASFQDALASLMLFLDESQFTEINSKNAAEFIEILKGSEKTSIPLVELANEVVGCSINSGISTPSSMMSKMLCSKMLCYMSRYILYKFQKNPENYVKNDFGIGFLNSGVHYTPKWPPEIPK